MNIPRTSLPRALEIIETEIARLDDLIHALKPEHWTLPTACDGWTVHDVMAHVTGLLEEGARPWLLLRRIRTARRRYPAMETLHGHNQVQVDDRRALDPGALVADFTRIAPAGLRGNRRVPAPLMRMRISRVFPEARDLVAEDSLDYLFKVLNARDMWMHRVDLADATGADLVLDGNDGEVVAQVVRDLAQTWTAPAVLLDLSGVAGGRWPIGRGEDEPVATLHADAIAFMRHLSGRPALGEVIIEGDPALAARLRTARVEF